jgi:hypothetical protein
MRAIYLCRSMWFWIVSSSFVLCFTLVGELFIFVFIDLVLDCIFLCSRYALLWFL